MFARWHAGVTTILAATALVAVAGCGDHGSDAPSPIGLDDRAPAVPANVTATTMADGSHLVSWRANRTDPDVQGYVVYRSTAVEGGYRPVVDEPIRRNSFVDAAPPHAASCYYRVAARDASANESPMSDPIGVRAPTALPTTASATVVPIR